MTFIESYTGAGKEASRKAAMPAFLKACISDCLLGRRCAIKVRLQSIGGRVVKFILLWVLVSGGQVTSGSAEFSDLAACGKAEAEFMQLAYGPRPDFRRDSVRTKCVSKGTDR